MDDQSELHDMKSHKRKRKHRQYDKCDIQKHCKHQKLELENVQKVSEEHDNNNSSASENHAPSEKLPKQSSSNMLQGTVDSQQGKDRKKKKRKVHKCTAHGVQADVKSHCEKGIDWVSLSSDGNVPVLHKHGSVSTVTATFVDDPSELQGKKSLKRRRHHYNECDKQKPCKCQKLECDNAGTSVQESVQNVHKRHHDNNSFGIYTASEKLQSIDDGQQQEKHKKKKKKKNKKMENSCHVAMGNHRTPYDAEWFQLLRRKKSVRSKKVRYNEDMLPHKNISKDLCKHASSPLPLPSVNVDSGSEAVVLDAATSAMKASEVSLVSELELTDASPDEAKCVEHAYKEHESSKLKHKRLTVNRDVETETANEYSAAIPEAPANCSSEVCNLSPTTNSSSEQHMNSNNILKLLHAENSTQYLRTKTEVKKAGKKLSYCIVITCSFINCYFLLVFAISINLTFYIHNYICTVYACVCWHTVHAVGRCIESHLH